jgi:pyrrolidone-carboxylate peptidase
MKNILITGFGAFLKHDANPAQEVALSLKKEGYDSVILPVSYEGAIAAFKAIKNIKQYENMIIKINYLLDKLTILKTHPMILYHDYGY